jgi:uncharacterized protein
MPRFDYRHGGAAVSPPSSATSDVFAARPHLPYVLPFFAYLLLMLPTSLGHFAGVDWESLLPFFYPLRNLAAAVLLWYFWPYYTRMYWGKLRLGVLVGLFGTVLWIASAYACQYLGFAPRPDFSQHYLPDQLLAPGWPLLSYLCLRVIGPTLVVPVMEELFFRDFVQRALIRGAHFQDIPIGTFTWTSLLGMSVFFGLNHGLEFFIPGVLYGLLMGILLIRTKSLGACIVAHGITNWTLYLYVIYTGDWQFM